MRSRPYFGHASSISIRLKQNIIFHFAKLRLLGCSANFRKKYISDPYVFGPPDPYPLVRGTDPDPSIIRQK
jgi:hypothetical protein